MKKVLLTLIAVLVLTVATKYVAVQAEEMAAQEPEAVVDNMINEAMNEMNEMNEMNMTNEMNEVVNEVAAGGGLTQ